ncbi:hypothetical protein KC327_g54 [Hortaea werneckii]|nr:hypothetical protein KC327_g54 [Hortaea werneckii]
MNRSATCLPQSKEGPGREHGEAKKEFLPRSHCSSCIMEATRVGHRIDVPRCFINYVGALTLAHIHRRKQEAVKSGKPLQM